MDAKLPLSETVVSRETSITDRSRLKRKTSSIDMHLGAKLRDARTFRHLSQTDLGDHLGLSFQQIQKYEEGDNRIAAATLHLFAKVLGIKPEWFFEGLDAINEGERPPMLDAQQRRLLEAFDRIAERGIRNGLAAFINALADGMAINVVPTPAAEIGVLR